jgi:adenylate cyclase class IV
MEGIVLRIRLVSGDSMDVTYEKPDVDSEAEVVEHVVSTLSDDAGVLRCRHGQRLLVLYARGVAAV